MAQLFRLSDEAWAAIDRHLPRGKPGKPRVDDRRVISGILHVLKTDAVGATCRRIWSGTTIYNRYNRWSQRGLWQRLFEQIAASGDVPRELSSKFACEGAPLGQRKGGSGEVGRPRGGAPRKSIVWPMIAAGRSLRADAGNVADISMAVPLLSAVTSPKHLIADKAYDADSLRNWLKTRRIKAVIPSTATRTVPYRSIAPFIGVATLSNASSAVSRTGDAWQHDTIAWPETISPRSLSSRSLSSGSE